MGWRIGCNQLQRQDVEGGGTGTQQRGVLDAGKGLFVLIRDDQGPEQREGAAHAP